MIGNYGWVLSRDEQQSEFSNATRKCNKRIHPDSMQQSNTSADGSQWLHQASITSDLISISPSKTKIGANFEFKQNSNDDIPSALATCKCLKWTKAFRQRILSQLKPSSLWRHCFQLSFWRWLFHSSGSQLAMEMKWSKICKSQRAELKHPTLSTFLGF